MHSGRLGPHHRDVAGNRAVAYADHQRFGRPVKYQRRQSRCHCASRRGVEQLLHRPISAAVLQPVRISPTPAGAGRFGNAGVGILEGPGTSAVSLGVAKQFRITEKLHARFETTFTNVLNHTNFAPPVTAIDSSTFGALTGPQTAENAGNRTGQAALRLDF